MNTTEVVYVPVPETPDMEAADVSVQNTYRLLMRLGFTKDSMVISRSVLGKDLRVSVWMRGIGDEHPEKKIGGADFNSLRAEMESFLHILRFRESTYGGYKKLKEGAEKIRQMLEDIEIPA